MKFNIVDKKISEIKADLELVFVVDKNLKHKFIKDEKAFKFANYKGDSVLVLLESGRVYAPLTKLDYDELRVAAAKAYNAVKSLNIKTIKLGSYIASCQKMSFQAVVEGILLGGYEFNKYKEKKEISSLEEIVFSTEEYADEKVAIQDAKDGFCQGEIIANATNFTKDIVNEIPEI